MKIALLGYGKMGREIEKIALQKGHSISFKISSSNKEDIKNISPQNTDVVIEFTSPQSAFENVKYCLEKGVAVVCGSTGWNQQKKEIEKMLSEKNTELAFFWASNFSVGLNIFLEINRYAAKIMEKYKEYDLSITEIHHLEKKDAPSGTAITLAEEIIKNNAAKSDWKLIENKDTDANPKQNTIPIFALREEGVKGTHTATYTSKIDDISLTHEAHSREGFAKGAVLAAEFVKGKKGVFGMKDLLNFS